MKPLGTSRKIENIEISLAMEAFGKLCERREQMAIFKAEKSAFMAAWESRMQHPGLSAEEAYALWNNGIKEQCSPNSSNK